MGKTLLSMGLDVGTSTTQLVITQLTVENHASGFCVPEMEISQRNILYKSPVQLTPLKGHNLVDGERLRQWVDQQYGQAGIHREQLDTGAIIITGETSRKENARTALHALSESAGNFVVATAGPHLESILAAKGAGADKLSEERSLTVLHMDIGGGTSNLALLKDGQIIATGCLNVGGRLVKFDESGAVCYRSPVLADMAEFAVGKVPIQEDTVLLCKKLAATLEMAAGLRPDTAQLAEFWTTEAGNPWLPPQEVDLISFSGGVAACMEQDFPARAFGDIGPELARAIRESLLCQMDHQISSDAIRATVIGAGCHSTQLSGSTVFYRGIDLPIKNLPVVPQLEQLTQEDGPAVLALTGSDAMSYDQVTALAQQIQIHWPAPPVLIAAEADMAKALGHALALRFPSDWGILCIDRVKFSPGSFLDVGQPVGSALPVVVKTLILNSKEEL